MTEKILPNFISLAPAAVAEEIADWLANQLSCDTRAYGVIGPVHGNRIAVFLKGGDVLVVDVNAGEVTT